MIHQLVGGILQIDPPLFPGNQCVVQTCITELIPFQSSHKFPLALTAGEGRSGQWRWDVAKVTNS